MASREFLKILSSARLGDASAQQKLAEAYLTGAFKTPVQPSNALIWLEKSYLTLKNQGAGDENSSKGYINQLFAQIVRIPLARTFNTPAFQFGWQSFWQLAEAKADPKSTFAAKWQLVDLLINPDNQEIQSQLMEWIKTRSTASSNEKLSGLDLSLIHI